MHRRRSDSARSPRFQCSSASRKFLNPVDPPYHHPPGDISVLFSEPKIPQLTASESGSSTPTHFSALQRAENSSILTLTPCIRYQDEISVLFSEPKIPQFARSGAPSTASSNFSALQRAENSSIIVDDAPHRPLRLFSALQRAENSSIDDRWHAVFLFDDISVLFSEPKIPQ